jgi:hypothetical protein
MSQQYPGQPPGGVVPPGYGSANPPQGFPGQQPVGLAASPKSNRALLWLGIGCGGFMLLGVAAVVIAVFWLKTRTNDAIDELQKLQSSALALPALSAVVAEPGSAELSGDCKIAHSCCQLIAEKSTAGAAALQACEVFKTAAYPQVTCAAALAGYRKAAEALGLRCEQ